MQRITNEILAEKIDTLRDTIDELKPEIKSNSEFRYTAKGVIGALTVIAGAVGGVIVFIFDKLIGK